MARSIEPEDYKKGQKNGKPARIVTAHSGKEYYTFKKLGGGGAAMVFDAEVMNDPTPYVFKLYNRDDYLAKQRNKIRTNVINLMKKPLTEADGSPLKHFISVIDYVPLDHTGTFGATMLKIDTDNQYKSVTKILGDNIQDLYPDAKSLCVLFKGFAHLMKRIHVQGYSYKDVNEGNMYVNPKTGDFNVIDFDNIAPPEANTVLGTPGYMAPEVYLGKLPDRYTDYFSLATFYFRMLTRNFPMFGPEVDRRLEARQDGDDENTMAKDIYGTYARFCFDPDPKNPNAAWKPQAWNKEPNYKTLTQVYNAIPAQIRELMGRTFVTGLPYDERHQRVRCDDWIACFEDLEQHHLVSCPHCGKTNFDNRHTCNYCSKQLPTPVPVPVPDVRLKMDSSAMVNGIVNNVSLTVKNGQTVNANQLHPQLKGTPVFTIGYRADMDVATITNNTQYEWTLRRAGKEAKLPPTQAATARAGLIIEVKPGVLMLRVNEMLK